MPYKRTRTGATSPSRSITAGGNPPPATPISAQPPSLLNVSGSVSFVCARRDGVAMTTAPPHSMVVLAAFIAPGAGVGVAVRPYGGIKQVTVRAGPRAQMCEEAA